LAESVVCARWVAGIRREVEGVLEQVGDAIAGWICEILRAVGGEAVQIS
jgi:hypothetical protein